MKFKNFTLDPFQVESIESIKKGNSVVVSAATGTGKTLIADYVIDRFLENKRIIYTAPIKALSNQKYRDFKKEYGEANVGIMTGDVVVNPDAPLLIMTTEIYRNMLLTEDPIIEYVKYVIFDEIHFINDIERGTIWEESIIFSPENIRFLALSATIPNAKEFADWISSIKHHTVDVVKYDKRAVPLKHLAFSPAIGVVTIDEAMRADYDSGDSKTPDHIQLIKRIKDKLPAIVFSFSRKKCEQYAVQLSRKVNFLNNSQRKEIIELTNHYISAEYRSLKSIQKLKQALSKGIAFHHAGLLPKAKELVEILFARGMIKALYATETFAVGINMPAKTVVFEGLEKYDGFNFRYLNSKEYFQLAGRAGRRGIDDIGYAISIIDEKHTDLKKLKKMSTSDDIPIKSQFKLSYNTVLNLIANYSPEERETILKMNFDYYLKKKKSNRQVRIMASFNNKLKVLKRMGYVRDGNLTEKGMFATKIYAYELLITEIFSSGIYKNLSNAELNSLIAAVQYEPRRKDYFTWKGIDQKYQNIMRNLSQRKFLSKEINKMHLKRMIRVVGDYTEGGDFKDMLKLCNLAEGDLIRLYRRIVDMLRQVHRATHDRILKERIEKSMDSLYRGVVKVEI